MREYLPTLSLRTKWNKPQHDIEEGDLVIIADEQHSPNLWLKGVVTTIFKSPDGAVRSAVVKTKLGAFRRPWQKLVILDNLNIKLIFLGRRKCYCLKITSRIFSYSTV